MHGLAAELADKFAGAPDVAMIMTMSRPRVPADRQWEERLLALAMSLASFLALVPSLR